MAISTLRNVSKVFDDPDNGAALVPVVDNVIRDVKADDFMSIIEASGCGKSALPRIIGGPLRATGAT